MTDLESVKIDKNGIPMEMQPHYRLFGKRFKIFEDTCDGDLYSFLDNEVEPYLKRQTKGYDDKMYNEYVIWIVSNKIVREFMAHYYSEQNEGLVHHMDEVDIKYHMEDLERERTFSDGRIFVIYG